MGTVSVKVLTIFFTSSCLACSSCRKICISSTPSYESLCETFVLDEFCKTEITSSDLNITLLSGKHKLYSKCIFDGAKSLILNGQSATVECSSNEYGGFFFYKVSTLKISDIALFGCGANWTMPMPTVNGLFSEIILAALFFDGGSDHTLTNVNVFKAKSVGICINNVAGKVVLQSCKIANASSSSNNSLSGNIIAFDYNLADSSNVTILQSSFVNSGNRDMYQGNCVLSFSSGLAMYLGSPLASVVINESTFSHNMGCNGGNMAVLFFNHTKLTISHTRFIDGKAHYGGGMYVAFRSSFLDRYSKVDLSNFTRVLNIVQSAYLENHAHYAGGGLYIQWKQSLTLKNSYEIEVENSTFCGNSLGNMGSGGLALHYYAYLDTSDDPYSFPLFHVILNITNSTFISHYPNILSTRLQSEGSVILAANVPYLGIKGITVESNRCTGILAIESTLVFYNSTLIQNNTALTGGGIRLCSSSTIYLTPFTNLTITNNSVQQTGGGIQVYSNCLINKPACFYQYSRNFIDKFLLPTVNFTVSNNRASKGGDNVYGGSLDNCYLIYVKKEKQFQFEFRVPNNTITQPSSITSDPQSICFNYSRDYTDEFMCNRSANVSIFPGEKVTFPVRVVGQFFGTVSGAVLVSVSSGGAIEDKEKAQVSNIPGENITYTVYSSQFNNFTTNPAVMLYLHAGLHNETSVHEYSERYLPAVVNVHFKECPFGFVNARDSSVSRYLCVCAVLHKFPIECSIQNQTITKPAGSWLGKFELENQTYLASNWYCPLDYCINSFRVIKTSQSNLSQDEQCQYNRTGILCGSCPEGWSMLLGSSECRKKCSNYWLILILPFTLAGLLLVAMIHYLNFTVTMGTVSGLIFYANIIKDHAATILLSQRIPVLSEILLIFLSWFNLDLGIPTCFYGGMEAFGKTMLLYIFPIYIWLISAVIVLLTNRYISFTTLVGKNAVKVLSTLFLLSYSKMIRITLRAFNLKYLAVHVNSSFSVHKIRWSLDGNVAYFSLEHTVLLIFAAFSIMLLLPFTFSLLCIKHIFSLSNCSKLFSWVDRLKPFFDTYTGPFKDSARFWTGLLLFVRLFFSILYVLDVLDDVISYYIIVVVCFLLLALMAYLHGIYKKNSHNALELFFILNIGIIFLLQTYKPETGIWIVIFTHVLVSSAFLVFLGVLSYHIYLKISHLGLLKRLAFWHRHTEMDFLDFEELRGGDDD